MTKEDKTPLDVPPGGGAADTPYPDYDLASPNKWAYDWDEKTRRLVLDRVHSVPEYRFFSSWQVRTLEAMCAHAVPQDDRPPGERAPVAPWIDERLYRGEGRGYRYEDMPDDRSAVTLDPGDKDQYGLPVARVTFAWGDNDKKIIKAGIERQREILNAAGAEVTWTADDTAHLLGACRMGTDPRNSVADRWCHSWEVPNLFVCDGSVFTTGTAVNPSLTIQAIASRTAEYIIAKASTGEFYRRPLKG